jgi:hypothetical protein
VRAQLFAFLLVQCLFQQRAENGGIDCFPIRLRRTAQFADVLAPERDDGAILEELAVEFANGLFQRKGEAAGVHRLPQLADQPGQVLRMRLAAVQQIPE